MILCDNPQKVTELFEGWHETMIYSYLQGCMGECYVDNQENPQSAQILIADFYFYAGVPCIELVKNIKSDFVIMVPQNEAWSLLIKDVYGMNATHHQRYATLKEKDIFDVEYLQSLVTGLDGQYKLKMIDQECYHKIIASSYEPFHDLCSQFKTYDVYQKYGLGCVIMKNQEIISGASSYTYYLEGIEIEVDTHPNYQGKGLAKICAAKLILECLKRNIYPSWDAHNQTSLALARKLGYQFDHSYIVYEIIK